MRVFPFTINDILYVQTCIRFETCGKSSWKTGYMVKESTFAKSLLCGHDIVDSF